MFLIIVKKVTCIFFTPDRSSFYKFIQLNISCFGNVPDQNTLFDMIYFYNYKVVAATLVKITSPIINPEPMANPLQTLFFFISCAFRVYPSE